MNQECIVDYTILAIMETEFLHGNTTWSPLAVKRLKDELQLFCSSISTYYLFSLSMKSEGYLL